MTFFTIVSYNIVPFNFFLEFCSDLLAYDCSVHAITLNEGKTSFIRRRKWKTLLNFGKRVSVFLSRTIVSDNCVSCLAAIHDKYSLNFASK